jgi:hypothetical protein
MATVLDLVIADLKVGDRVGFCRTHYGTLLNHGFGTVSKINGHGHITIIADGNGVPDNFDTQVYDKHGNEFKKGYGCRQLCAVEWLQSKIDAKTEDRRCQAAVKSLIAAIENHRCGNGKFSINEEAKSELHRLVDAI